jgi:toxin HigB-1
MGKLPGISAKVFCRIWDCCHSASQELLFSPVQAVFWCAEFRLVKNKLEIIYIPCYYISMIQAFKSSGTEAIFNGINSPKARKTCPNHLWKVAARKLDQLDSVINLDELRLPPGNHLEALGRDRKGQYSLRINDQYRICFFWTDKGPDLVEIVDYH